MSASAILLVLAPVCLGQPSVPPLTEEVRIGVQLRLPNGDPVDHLSPADFRLSVGTQIFPFTLARPALKKSTPASVPTRLLVIFSPLAPRGSDDPVPSVIEELKPVWRTSWQVSLFTPEGRQTPYASSGAELQRLIHQNVGSQQTWVDAVRTIRTFPGRRLVVYVSEKWSRPPDGLAKAAREAAAMFYDVGGDIYQNYSFGEAVKGSTDPLPSYGASLYGPNPGPPGGLTVVNNVETWSAPAQLSIGDVHIERSFGRAISDAIRDARNYYELRLQVPVPTAWLVLGVSVSGEYRLTAQSYTPDGSTAPGIVLLRPKR